MRLDSGAIFSKKVATLICYLAPRAFPLLVVLLITFLHGREELGEVAFAFSLISFFVLSFDWGVSQWLLLEPRVDRKSVRTAFKGRLAFITLIGIPGCILLVLVGLIDTAQIALLVAGILTSLSQNSFSWYIRSGSYLRAYTSVFIEFITPLSLLFLKSDATTNLTFVFCLKLLLSVTLTAHAIRLISPNSGNEIDIRRFGNNSALWALTSVGAGTGELSVLQGESTSISGAYRLIQTIGSAGSIVGFAAQAPLLGKRTSGSDLRHRLKVPIMLGVVSAGSSLIAAIVIKPATGLSSDDLGFVSFALVTLIVNATLSSAAIVPATALTRKKGTRPLLYSGLCSSAIYWLLIVIAAKTNVLELVPISALVSTLVGTSINISQLKRIR